MPNDESCVRGGITRKEPDYHDFHSYPEIKGQSDQSDQIIGLREDVHIQLFSTSLLACFHKVLSIRDAARSFDESILPSPD
jgi:hypothetical protein